MTTQRLEEKRVEERVGERERKREREREREKAHARGRGRERAQGFGSSFYKFASPGPALCKLGLARSAVSST